MIAKIPKPGKSFGGCIEYNVLKKDAAVLYAYGIRTDQIRHIITDFNMQRKMNPGLGKAVGHIALSWSPNDKDKLNDEVMIGIAKDYLQRMKINNTQVLMVRHKDREHPHLHIIYNRVNNEGKTIADNFQRQKSIKICKSLTIELGLFVAQDKQHVNRQQIKGIDKIKYELHDKIKAVSKQVTTVVELKRALAKQGIGTQFKYKGGTLEVQGISFSKGKYKFKGSELDGSLSYGKLSKQLQDQALGRQQAQRLEQTQDIQKPQSLAGQLRQAISVHQGTDASAHVDTIHDSNFLNEALNLTERLLSVSPQSEPEEPNRRKKKNHDQEQSQGISR